MGCTWKSVEVGGEAEHCDDCRVKAWTWKMIILVMVMLVMMIINDGSGDYHMNIKHLTDDQVEHVRKCSCCSCQETALLEERQPHLRNSTLHGFTIEKSSRIWAGKHEFLIVISVFQSPPADRMKGGGERRRRWVATWWRCQWRPRRPTRRWWSPAGGRQWGGAERRRRMQEGPGAPRIDISWDIGFCSFYGLNPLKWEIL